MKYLLLSWVVLASVSTWATSEDRRQPIEMQYNFLEFDLNTGTQVYSGNVTLVQGNLKITAERLEAQFKDNQLVRAEAFGDLATVEDRMDGESEPLMIKGRLIELDTLNQQIIVTESAQFTMGQNLLQAYRVFYDMKLGKVSASKGSSEDRVKMKLAPLDEQ